MDRWIDTSVCLRMRIALLNTPSCTDLSFTVLPCPANSFWTLGPEYAHFWRLPSATLQHAFAHSLISTHTLGTPSHTSISHPRALHVRLLAIHHSLELIHHIPAPIPLLRTRTLRSPQRTPIQARAGDINRIRPLRPERDGSRRPARQELERHD